MKPIFGIDVTTDKNNEELNGNEFIIATAPKAEVEALEEKQDALAKTVDECGLPTWLRILKGLCGIAGLMIALGAFKAATSIGIAQTLSNAPVLLICGILCLAVWGVFSVVEKKQEKALWERADIKAQVEEIKADVEQIYEALGVPSDAVCADVLTFKYKMKNGEPYVKMPCVNSELKIYVSEGRLCLSRLESVYSFDITELRSIKAVNKRISILSWNKDEEPDSEEYKKYKMTVGVMGDVSFKLYYVLELERGGELYGIYFPCYELDVLERITGISAEK